MADRLIIKSVYMHPDMVYGLSRRAADDDVQIGTLTRRYVEEGLKSPDPSMSAIYRHASRHVLRSVYLDPSTKDALANRAKAEGITEAELARRYIYAGLLQPADWVKKRLTTPNLTKP